MTDTVLSLVKISKKYDIGSPAEVVALDGVTFSVSQGELISVIGSSGSGKSTLLHIMGLLDRPTEGTYELDGNPVHHLSGREASRMRNAKIGFVFQAFNLLRRGTVYQNVALPLLYSKSLRRNERKNRVMRVLKQVGLEDRLKAKSNELSGGQQQRVAIARALVTDPSIILADEPTGNLDSRRGQEIVDILKQLHAQGKTIIIVTHDQQIASQTQRRITLKDGKIIEDKRL